MAELEIHQLIDGNAGKDNSVVYADSYVYCKEGQAGVCQLESPEQSL